MPSMESDLLGREWTALHGDCEKSERSALWIKLVAMALTVVVLALGFDSVLAILLLAMLWLQEAIVRTGQARLVTRLLLVEAQLGGTGAANDFPCQLYSQWQLHRPGTLGLLSQYLSNALRPTVAFPYAALVVLLWAVTVTA
jgi:hypothetical protein